MTGTPPRACSDPACDGVCTDGFCDTCGRSELADVRGIVAHGPSAPAQIAREGGYSRITGRVTPARRPSAAHATSARSSPSAATGASGSQRRSGIAGSSTRRHALGAGLVEMPVMPSTDPMDLVVAHARVPDGRAICPACGNRVNPEKRFCANCGTEYSFKPSLRAGDILADQYEVKGPIAFGGLGWIYLAMDTRLNRWVVLKGLLNSRDPAAAAAAVAERQFLAATKHGKIVRVYTFVTHGGESFIVMEYVGGRTLKAIRKERGPLPTAEAIAFILGILPAFAYLHEQGLVYCDFKPDNVMLEGDDVKLIDMGAVRRIDDVHGDVYSTIGYQAPEAGNGPTAASDIYTIGRTLAVLLIDFDNTGKYGERLPPPNALLQTIPEPRLRDAGLDPAGKLTVTLPDGVPLPAWLRWHHAGRSFVGTAPVGVTAVDVVIRDGVAALPITLTLPLASNESLYRLLLKATATNPDDRFQSADDMAAQLTGVLRETVAREGEVPAMESTLFLRETTFAGDPWESRSAWRRLPELRLDAMDPAAADTVAALRADGASREVLLAEAGRHHADSAEALLRRADVLVMQGEADVNAVMKLLDAALALQPSDFRPDWYCGKLYLSLDRAADAVACFDQVYSEIPGESSPKLALALALEQSGRVAEAAGLYETVHRTDPSFVSAAFGLARCQAASGDRGGAVATLEAVPESSAMSVAARLRAARVLADSGSNAAQLERAFALLDRIRGDDIPWHEVRGQIALQAAQQAEASGDIAQAREMRRRAEAACRACGRLSDDAATRISYVDRANAVRQRTLV